MNPKKSILIIVIAVVLIALGVWVGKEISGKKGDELSPYSAVYLATGDIYFGKLSWFPWPKISNVWYLERRVNPSTQSPELNVLPLKSVVWGPVGNEISLNPKEVVFWTRLARNNRIAKAIDDSKNQASQGLAPAVSGEGFEPSAPPATTGTKE